MHNVKKKHFTCFCQPTSLIACATQWQSLYVHIASATYDVVDGGAAILCGVHCQFVGEPSGELKSAIEKDFGSFEDFKKEFSTAGATQFGSGWAWLIKDGGKLKVSCTASPCHFVSIVQHRSKLNNIEHHRHLVTGCKQHLASLMLYIHYHHGCIFTTTWPVMPSEIIVAM